MTQTSILKGTKNFTHAINLAKQLVFGKEVPANGRLNTSSKSGGKKYQKTQRSVVLNFFFFTVSQTNPSSTHKANGAKPAATSAAAKAQKLSNKDKIPLIIVPAAPTAKFTLYNIKQFLEDQM